MVFDADREISTRGSTDNAGNSVNLIFGIIHLPAGWDFSVCIGDRRLILFVNHLYFQPIEQIPYHMEMGLVFKIV